MPKSFYEVVILKEFLSKGYALDKIQERMIEDKNFRKEVDKKYAFVSFNAIEKCVADATRIMSDKSTKLYRQRTYNTDKVFPDGVIVEDQWGYLVDTNLTEIIYYDKNIEQIYQLKRLEYIKSYHSEDPLSFLEFIYPSKMPREDYYPFLEFKYGTEIPILLTEEEKKANIYFSSLKIDETALAYNIIWLDKYRMLMNLNNEVYYFKKFGKDLYFYELSFPV